MQNEEQVIKHRARMYQRMSIAAGGLRYHANWCQYSLPRFKEMAGVTHSDVVKFQCDIRKWQHGADKIERYAQEFIK